MIRGWKDCLSDDILAIICGFLPGQIPGVGAYYDFLDRFWLASKPGKIKKFKRKPKKKLKAGKKLPPKHPEIVKMIVKYLLRGRKFESKPEKILHRILATAVVLPSAKRGLLGDPEKLAISGDGSLYATGGRPYGKKLCRCEGTCGCQRRFSDPKSQLGLKTATGRDGFSGIPPTKSQRRIAFTISRFILGWARLPGVNSVLGLRALCELRDLYPFVFQKFIGDSAHDAYPWYELLHTWEIEAFIDLNTRRQGKLSLPGFTVGKDGAPVCAGGFPMVFFRLLRRPPAD